MSSQEFNHPSYINVPFFILQDKTLEFFDKFLFAFLWSFSIAGRKITVSNPYLASLFQVSERHIQDRLKFLEDNAYIFRHKINNHRFIKILKKPEDDIGITEDTKDTGGMNPGSGGGEPQFVEGRTTVHPYIKDNNKDNKTYADAKARPVDKSSFLTIEDLLKDNPHNLSKQSLLDWILVRKRKKADLVQTSWDWTNKMLTKLVEKGLSATYCFELMVSSGWQGLKLCYFENEIKNLSGKIGKERSIQLEKQAEMNKKAEIAASHQCMTIVNKAVAIAATGALLRHLNA